MTDLLSHLLSMVRLTGESLKVSEHEGEWSLDNDAGAAAIHVVLVGDARLEIAGGRHVFAGTGDLLLLPLGHAHNLSATDATPAKLFTARFHFEGDRLPFVNAELPPLIMLPATVTRDEGWVQGLSHFMMVETGSENPGADLMISRLIDVMVIRALRCWTQSADAQDWGWFGALSDPRIARAVRALHGDAFRDWTHEELAGIAGMSRSSFAERFSALVGTSPMQYHKHWRLARAAEQLRSTDVPVSTIARDIGYDSEAAFSRAFKARFGYPPSQVRTAH